MLNSLKRIFGKRLLCEISGEDILSYRSRVASEFTNVTSNRYLFIIKQLFKRGIGAKAILDDPADPINYLSEREQERSNFLLPSELDRLVDASLKTRSKFYLPSLIYLGAEHGASKQESLSLKWSDIDFEYERQGLIKFFRTKNNRERIEYLMPRTKAALLEWQNHLKIMRHKRRIEFPREGFVFSKIDGKHIKRFDKAWKAACKMAGLEDFHFHDLRHTFCSNLLLSGSGLKDVKEMIGHSDLSMTDRYSHLTLNHKRLRQSKLAEHYARSG
jgi:integrase